jgi:CHASE2 domain-containing sensor protein
MTKFYLQVQQVEQKCLFQLSWNNNQKITAELPYPETIISLYQTWQRTYHQFYSQELRGKVIDTGTITPPPVDWQAQLVQAEVKLLYEFHQWLRSKELYDIRSTITTNNPNISPASGEGVKCAVIKCEYINIFISCNSPELTRLPWESWEISTELSTTKVRIARQPVNIHQSIKKVNRTPGKARILAIFGDEINLSFDKEKEAILSLKKLVKVELICWQKDKDIRTFKDRIVEKLKSKKGWDILFFAGHSRETDLTGGQISIAPNATIYLSELEQPLTIAIQNGLQFALFNSCDGLSIANKLIDLGLNQVAIMRERVHNTVAEEIFIKFLNTIFQYQDVHQALLAACDYLKLEKNLTYPSAYLIPSLFRHPDAEIFQLKPFGIIPKIKQWLPNRRELYVLGILSTLSLLPPIQDAVLDWQIGIQAIYRHVTQQVPKDVSQPPVLVVSVDEKSLNEGNVKAEKFNPIDRSYLARIIDNLTVNNPKIIGIDYLLDRATDENKILAKSIQNSIAKNQTLFIFGAILTESNQEQGVHKNIANLNQTLQGSAVKLPGHLSLLDKNSNCIQICPFTYLIALTDSLDSQTLKSQIPQVTQSNNNFDSKNSSDLRTNLIRYLNEHDNSSLTQPQTPNKTNQINKLRLSPITTLSQYFEQAWLYPVIDYSLPPNQVYQVISAKDIVQANNITSNQEKIKQKIILIGAGGYGDAGLSQFHSDNFPLPMGVAYWRMQNNSGKSLTQITGVEINAYMVQHLLKQHLIIPIPDLWIIGIAGLFAKGTQLLLIKFQDRKYRKIYLFISFIGGTVTYILMSMQMYISASIILPIFLPTALFWFYIAPNFRNKNDI